MGAPEFQGVSLPRPTPFFFGVHIGVHRLPDQLHQFIFRHRVVAFEDLHGPVPRGGHDSKEVVPLKAPIIYTSVPEVMEGEIFNPRLLARACKDGLISVKSERKGIQIEFSLESY